jgi:hypothetical protein
VKWLPLVLLLLPATALAEPAVKDIPAGEDKITAVRKGEPAPYDGQLYDPATSLRWANWLMQYRYRLKMDVVREQEVCAIEVTHRDSLLDIEKERAKQVEADLFLRLERSEEARIVAETELRNPSWYNTREFGITLGVLGTASVMALSIWAIEARR